MGKQLAESKICTYLQDYQSQFKNYEPYYYRTLTHLISSVESSCPLWVKCFEVEPIDEVS